MSRILIFSPTAFVPHGHGSNYASGLAEGLSQFDAEVHVVGYEGPLALQGKGISHGVPIPNRDYDRRPGLAGFLRYAWKRRRRDLAFMRGFAALYEELGRPFTVFEAFEYGSVDRFVKKENASQNYVCVLHETNFNFRHGSPLVALYKRSVRSNVESILRNSVCCFVHGKAMRDNLIENVFPGNRAVAEKVKILPHGAPSPRSELQIPRETALETLGLDASKRYLLSFGTLRTDKKFEPVLAVLRETDGWMWLLAGPEGDYQYACIRELARQFGVEDKIVIHNRFLPLPDHPVYFGCADAVVNLYQDYIRHESGTAQKARAFLKPVIVDGPPDLTDYVTSEGIGWKIDASDVQAFKRLLDQIAHGSDEEKTQLAARIRRCAEERSWENVGRIIMENIRPFLTERPA
ncbi:MAG: hypothetical protein HUU20_28580 [Pirellulales bacterium]|nr:hypothetical protein [Pirellulales bacterium]